MWNTFEVRGKIYASATSHKGLALIKPYADGYQWEVYIDNMDERVGKATTFAAARAAATAALY